jgi:hypothetical protein
MCMCMSVYGILECVCASMYYSVCVFYGWVFYAWVSYVLYAIMSAYNDYILYMYTLDAL